MLKWYLYGDMNKVRSSRMLERETQRNMEVIWLLAGLTPSHAAIAHFRKNNLDALKAANRDFVQVCREWGLYGAKDIGIDGRFVRGHASMGSIHTQEKLEKQRDILNKRIDEYTEQLEHNDKTEQDEVIEDAQLREKLEKLQERQTQCQNH